MSLALAILCSIAVAMLLKLVERRRADRAAVLAVNYASALALALALRAGGGVAGAVDTPVVALGVITGALFLSGYYVFGAAIRSAGVGLATGVMRLSVAIPVLGSWLLFSEVPTAGQGAGLALAGVAFFLIARPGESGPTREARSQHERGETARAIPALALLFVVGGAVDLAMKAFAHTWGDTVGEPDFLVVVFASATVLGAALVVVRRVRGGGAFGVQEVALGAAIGVVNYGSAAFILRAAGAMPAPLVFPTNAVAIMVGVAVLAVVVWRERLTRGNLAGLVIAAIALALLWGGRDDGA